MNNLEIDATQLHDDLHKVLDDGIQIYRSLMTCTDRLTYATVRLRDIQGVIQEKIVPYFEQWRDSFDVEEPEGVFHQSQWKIRMLATESVQHLHSFFDPLACAVYWFNVPEAERKILPRDLNLYKVRTCESIPAKYRELLTSLASSDSFFHLSALSNLAKHSQIVHPAFSHLTDGVVPATAEHAMIFEPCKGQHWINKERGLPTEINFPRTPISIFLRAELLRIAPLFNRLAALIRSDLDMRLKAEKL